MIKVFFGGKSNFTASSLNPAVFQLLAICEQLEHVEKLSLQAGDETGAALNSLAKRRIREIIQTYIEETED